MHIIHYSLWLSHNADHIVWSGHNEAYIHYMKPSSVFLCIYQQNADYRMLSKVWCHGMSLTQLSWVRCGHSMTHGVRSGNNKTKHKCPRQVDDYELSQIMRVNQSHAFYRKKKSLANPFLKGTSYDSLTVSTLIVFKYTLFKQLLKRRRRKQKKCNTAKFHKDHPQHRTIPLIRFSFF